MKLERDIKRKKIHCYKKEKHLQIIDFLVAKVSLLLNDCLIIELGSQTAPPHILLVVLGVKPRLSHILDK